MAEYLPKTLDNGRERLLSEDDNILIKQFSFYLIEDNTKIKIKNGHIMRTPCIEINGSLYIDGAMEVS